jgi:hypothetical protein
LKTSPWRTRCTRSAVTLSIVTAQTKRLSAR